MSAFKGRAKYFHPQKAVTDRNERARAETGKVVPTWNHEAVHAYGRLEIMDAPADILPIVTKLTERYEGRRAKPWAVADAPGDYIAAQLKGIVGVVLHVARLEGKRKLSHNKTKADQEGVVAGLEGENVALAAAMKRVAK